VLIDNVAWVAGRSVLDFGAGGGIASLAAAKAGAARVVANDIDPWALTTIALAAARQDLTIELLDTDLTANPKISERFDLVLCSDLAYERRMAPRQRALLQHARNHGARVLIADAGRTYFDATGLSKIASFTIDVPRDLEGVEVRVASVYEMNP
jgi:predicted nicotinamide N-methyase